mmetsp:Transcript_2654/g.4779  ORF Transcript_2654/g.4779 Transcript_2654/m.4779 type:complete len:208 (+) Transcript_2654:2110-2733(+)
MSRSRLLTKRSRLFTRFPILMISHCIWSSNILTACFTGTLRARSLIKSRAFMIMNGSKVFLVVRTVIEPSIKLSSQAIPRWSKEEVTTGQTSRRYFSRYAGNNVANEDSSRKGPLLASSTLNGSIFQWSIPSWSHGLSFLYWFFLVFLAADSSSLAIVTSTPRGPHASSPTLPLSPPVSPTRRNMINVPFVLQCRGLSWWELSLLLR